MQLYIYISDIENRSMEKKIQISFVFKEIRAFTITLLEIECFVISDVLMNLKQALLADNTSLDCLGKVYP